MVTISDEVKIDSGGLIFNMSQYANVEKEKKDLSSTNSLSNFDPKKNLGKLDLTNNFATDYYTTFR